MAKVNILKIDSKGRESLQDIVTEEVPLTIHLDNDELLTLLCSPEGTRELCVGFFFSSGLIKSFADIKNIVIDRQRWRANIKLNKSVNNGLVFKRLYTSGCGKGTLFYNAVDFVNRKKIASILTLKAEIVKKLMDCFQDKSIVFRETGGVHSAALCQGDEIMIFKEDIGRHNAIDKVIGEALIKKIDMKKSIVLTSGRISSEIVSKVSMMGAAFLVSRSAPTNQAVNWAKTINLTLIGFVRGTRMNVYSAEERIV